MSTVAPNMSLAEAMPLDVFSERYSVRLAQTQKEIESALRLRYKVFNVELAGETPAEEVIGLEYDQIDFVCKHLIVVEKETQETVGTYRLNSLETAEHVGGFYSFSEFSIEDLPHTVLAQAVEIGRACIARDHRNTKVLFLLWKGLARYLKQTEKRYFFGCCSIFTTDYAVGLATFEDLRRGRFLHKKYRVKPREEKLSGVESLEKCERPQDLPPLFNMYLKIGAKICGKPIVDHDFGTIDFFVIFDIQALNEKYRRMFFGENSQTKTLSSRSDLKSLSNVSTVEHRVP